MKKGETSIGKITKYRFPDEGIIETNGKRVAIRHAIPGQTVEYVITRKKNNNMKARVLRVVESSGLENAKNPCEKSGICGGCLYQTLDYENQLRLKEDMVADLLRAATADDFLWEGIFQSPQIFGYRNKMEYSFGDEYKDGPLALGMHKRGSHYDIVNVDSCNIVHEDFGKILRATREFFFERGVKYYHKLTHEGLLRHLLIRRSVKNEELLINLVTTNEFLNAGSSSDSPDFVDKKTDNVRVFPLEHNPKLHRLLTEWKEMILSLSLQGKISGILHTSNNSLADAVIDQGTTILYGKNYITENLLGLEFKISAFSFFQTNSQGSEVLYEIAGKYVGDTTGMSVFDLYSGTGTIAQLLAKVAENVIGVEIVEEAVQAARENADRNGLKNCRFIAGDVQKVIGDLNEKPDIIILDPPRDGIHPKALPIILNFGAKEIIYISCKPSSLARDLAVLNEGGYTMVKACAVDMFPHTSNVEAVVKLSKRDINHHIDLEINEDDLKDISVKKEATYSEIKDYVFRKFELKVSTLNIAQVKRKLGIIERENYNHSKKENQRVPNCPPKKEQAIIDALSWFGMIE